MQLGDEDIQEFCDIWQQEFGEALSPEKARVEAGRLLELYALLAGMPIEGTTGARAEMTRIQTSL